MPNSNSSSAAEAAAAVEKKVESSGYSPAHSEEENYELANAKAEMSEVLLENARLKQTLQHMMKDYQSLQLRLFDILGHDQRHSHAKKPINLSSPIPMSAAHVEEPHDHQLLSLSLGRSPREDHRQQYPSRLAHVDPHHQDLKANLDLELGSKLQSPTELVLSGPIQENSSEDPKESEASPSSTKTTPKTTQNQDDEASQQANAAKRARVSVRARCEFPTMNDGCQWRKYGQKIAKGNPCPRAYYRCTVAQGCPVRKQVQRCIDDMSILITTYEGTHSHPLPMTATSMASTTSAAASMLLSGSSMSQQPGLGANNVPNFGLFDNSRSQQLYMPKLSSSPSFPTVTLDLTSSSFNQNCTFPPSLNFSSSESNTNLLTSWGNGYPKFGTLPHPFGNQNREYFLPNHHQSSPLSQVSLTESLTKAITSDPNFKSVIAVALSSMVGGGNTAAYGSQDIGDRLRQDLTQNGKGFASSIFNSLSTTDSQKGNLTLLQPPLPVLESKSNTSTPAIRDTSL